MTAADKAPSLRVQHIEQAIGATAERQRIRRAIAGPLRELRHALYDYPPTSLTAWAIKVIDRATRAPKGKRK